MVLALVLFGCDSSDSANPGADSAKDSGERDSAGTEDSPQDTVDTSACGDNAPVWTFFDVSEGEPAGEHASVRFDAYFSDVDADLNIVVLDAWFDDAADGTVDTSGTAAITTGEVVQKEGMCDVSVAAVAFEIPVDGSPLANGTPYDFAVIVYDQAGHPSVPAFDSYTTPAALD